MRASPATSRPGTLRIRRALPADRVRLARLGRASYRAHFAPLWESAHLAAWLDAEFAAERLDAELRDRAIRYDLAWIGGRLAGFAKTVADRALPNSRRRGTELQKLYLSPWATGRGVGTRLLGAVLRRAQAQGAPLVWLGVLDVNPRARALYARLGFVATGASAPVGTGRCRLRLHFMLRRCSASKASSARSARSTPRAIISSAR
jgi:ribosomal protein S18 acetylase RimI-like enzyme